MKFDVERKHIHEISNHLTIVHGAVKKTLKELEKSSLLPEEQERLKKADDYLKQTTLALKELRAEIIEKINSLGGHDEAP